MQSEKAPKVFREIMDNLGKAIPNELLDGTESVAVFPEVSKERTVKPTGNAEHLQSEVLLSVIASNNKLSNLRSADGTKY